MTHLLIAVIYLSFISLGLPDALLGAAWPTIYPQFEVPVSYAGIVAVTISFCTIITSLLSDRLTLRFGPGKVTAFSVMTTAIALFGFSSSTEFWMLVLWAIPYGLGAGGVDASLNNYVALHYSSKHMSWLHCMWGVGAAAGPYVMGHVLTTGRPWSLGYSSLGILQVFLTAALFASLPLWKKRTDSIHNHTYESETAERKKPLSIPEILKIPGAKEVLITFFCYCALEQTAGLWASSYLSLHKGVPSETAASFASMFYIGITVGRAIGGFLTMKLNDTRMIRLGQSIVLAGVIIMLLPLGETLSLVALILVGLGCAPIYPGIIHSTPAHFGADKSQAVIGLQMAFAYSGNCIMPPLFGLIANHISVALYPVYLLLILGGMVIMHERLIQKTGPA